MHIFFVICAMAFFGQLAAAWNRDTPFFWLCWAVALAIAIVLDAGAVVRNLRAKPWPRFDQLS